MTETYKRLRKNPLSIAGWVQGMGTLSGVYPVVSGFFTLVDGQGIPLDVVLHYFNDRLMVPDWLGFFMEAIERGWNPVSTVTKIKMACEDVYGTVHAGIVASRLEGLIR